MRNYLARRDNVVDMNLWMSEKQRRRRRTAARDRERRVGRRFKFEARVLAFPVAAKEQDEVEMKRLRVAGSNDPDCPRAS